MPGANVVAWTVRGARVAKTALAAAKVSKASKVCKINSFVPGTLVLMAHGSTKPIEDVQLGEFVLATDPLTGETSAREVKDLITGEGEKNLVTISADSDGDGKAESIQATDGHPIYTATQGWTDAGDLQVGDLLVGDDGSLVEVTALDVEIAAAVVYNLTIDGVPSYYVLLGDSPVLAHNCGDVRAANFTASSWGARSKAAAIAKAKQVASRTRGEYRGPCSAGNHCHVDFRNGRGEIKHTIHIRWKK